MTVEQLYTSALSCIPSNSSEDDSLRQYMVMWTNLLLRETLKYENAWLASRKEEELKQAPSVATLSDEIPYESELVENAFIWGIAAFMCKDDDDTYHEQDYRARYVSACIEYTPMVFGPVIDIYKGEDGQCLKS